MYYVRVITYLNIKTDLYTITGDFITFLKQYLFKIAVFYSTIIIILPIC